MSVKWEFISENTTDRLDRYKVPGGWLYRNIFWVADNSVQTSMVFVPEKPGDSDELI